MNIKKGDTVELTITAMAFGGEGLGKHEGMTVFTDKVVPGDEAEVRLMKVKKNFAEAKTVRIIKTSPDRVKAKCPYAEVCGGCNFQFLDYEKQLEIKEQSVIDALERLAKINNPPVNKIIGCKEIYYYRNKMEFSFGYDEQMNFAMGLHMPGRKFDILDLNECHLESLDAVEILKAVKAFCFEKKWPPFKYSVGEGFLKNLIIREGKRTNEIMVILVTSDDAPENFQVGLEELKEILVAKVPKITSIYWQKTISKRGMPRRTEDTLIHGSKVLNEKMILENGDALDFEILPQAFFQVNTLQAEVLYHEVLKLVSDKNHEMIFDLFCGTGTIGLFLAKHAERVWGVEMNTDAVRAAAENAKKNKITNIDFFNGDVTEVLKKIKERPSLVVVDPPRAGLTQKLVDKINDFGAKEIIYVSCNPATFARDLTWLQEFGYKLKSVQPVDMFPHSYHIETVAKIER